MRSAEPRVSALTDPRTDFQKILNSMHAPSGHSDRTRKKKLRERIPQKLNAPAAADCVTHAARSSSTTTSLYACHGTSAQKHLRCTMVGPDSSYSVFEIHICWNVDSDDRIAPPIQTEYLRSGGAITLIFIVDGASAVSSFVMRSPMPANIVVPPERTTFAYKSLRMSTSHFMMDWNVVSWIPLASLPMKDGWKSTSGQRKRSLPTVITFPSGSSYVFSFSELSAAAFISVSKSSATYDNFSLTSRTIARSAVVVNEYPRSVKIFIMYSVRSRPARSRRKIACGRA